MGIEEGFRLLAKHEEKINRRRTEEALAAGFTSFEEYQRHKERQEGIEQEEAIRQHCLATGNSREQYDQEGKSSSTSQFGDNRSPLNREDIKIQDTDKSKRLDQEHWDLYMASKPGDATVDFAFLGKGRWRDAASNASKWFTRSIHLAKSLATSYVQLATGKSYEHSAAFLD
ncbi:MAG: hypothetical protein Q9204_002432 [Flavoplaca sp. TL-2023a]